MITKSVRVQSVARLGAAAALVALCVGCGVPTWRSALVPVDAPFPAQRGDDTFLKLHAMDGGVYLLESWTVPGPDEDVEGVGWRFDSARQVGSGGSAFSEVDGEGTLPAASRFTIPRSEIVLLETNRKEVVGRFGLAGLVAWTTLTATTTFICLADPKSCFGSCPTFYTEDDPERPVAEAFSSSFARALEDDDLDALNLRVPPGPFSLVMRNEAQETHAVRRARLLAVPAASDEEVLPTADGALRSVARVRGSERCTGADGSCLDAVRARDDVEYAPRTDPDDLGAREDVILDFGPASGETGVVLSARNSFVTTYVFYQSLAYAGSRTGDLLAALERGEPGADDRVLGMARELGGIEVAVSLDGGPWAPVGSFEEAGPIAADRQVIPIGRVEADEVRVRLRMARGSWRVDEAALADLGRLREAVVIEPDSVTAIGAGDPAALERLASPDEYLVTVSGDAYRLWFTIPEGAEHALFLDSRGYYYEWMRAEWLVEESPLHTATALLQPREALKAMAPRFKEIESEFDRLFWSSRFRRESR